MYDVGVAQIQTCIKWKKPIYFTSHEKVLLELQLIDGEYKLEEHKLGFNFNGYRHVHFSF